MANKKYFSFLFLSQVLRERETVPITRGFDNRSIQSSRDLIDRNMAIFPGDCWRLVHAKHHYWTGRQDLDMTTESLTPRSRSRLERWGVNVSWALWTPRFATLYRLNNY